MNETDDAVTRHKSASGGLQVAEEIVIRRARPEDVPAIVAMLASDEIGGHGDTLDDTSMSDYRRAFEDIDASSHQRLYVAEAEGAVVGTFQTVTSRTMTARGGATMTLRAVQTRADCRGRGIGAAMMRFAIAEAEMEGVRLIDLSSNGNRKDAHRFYQRLGFVASHIGFKMKLK
ncbi:N-acetyltransferase family protein [Rhizobium sp. PAMB 3174]